MSEPRDAHFEVSLGGEQDRQSCHPRKRHGANKEVIDGVEVCEDGRRAGDAHASHLRRQHFRQRSLHCQSPVNI